ARAMVDSTSLPVIADCDTGFGNAINVIRTVRDFEAAGVAAISIEDNVFPKRCSFYTGVARELAPLEEHAGKVRAAKSAQRSDDFFVIARTEALIAGWGKEEALLRARAYADAGADAVLIHSKHPDFSELEDVARAWDRDIPMVSVPTTYIQTPLDTLMQGGFPLVIYANQSLRASVVAMADALQRLRADGAEEVEKEIAPLEEIYRLVGVPELKKNEGKFLLADGADCAAVILAAGDGGRLGKRGVTKHFCHYRSLRTIKQ
ncbi:MAG: isocitrate lyase/phosphoenolpyruvate mutase family protein, partial [bacterium]